MRNPATTATSSTACCIARGVADAEAQRVADAARAQYGLNDPLPLQYINWIGGIVTRGDFGFSFFYNRPVSSIVAERLPRTILLALTCHILASAASVSPSASSPPRAVQLGRHAPFVLRRSSA